MVLLYARSTSTMISSVILSTSSTISGLTAATVTLLRAENTNVK